MPSMPRPQYGYFKHYDNEEEIPYLLGEVAKELFEGMKKEGQDPTNFKYKIVIRTPEEIAKATGGNILEPRGSVALATIFNDDLK